MRSLRCRSSPAIRATLQFRASRKLRGQMRRRPLRQEWQPHSKDWLARLRNSWRGSFRQPRAGNIHGYAVEARLCRQVQRSVIIAAPGEIVRMLRNDNGAEMFAFGRDDPEAARARQVKIALLIDFHAVPSVFAGFAGGVKEDVSI